MVSKASEDLPDPETPVTTVSWLCGISKSMFFRLWTRAPRTTILSFDMAPMFSAYAQVSQHKGEPGAPGRAHIFVHPYRMVRKRLLKLLIINGGEREMSPRIGPYIQTDQRQAARIPGFECLEDESPAQEVEPNGETTIPYLRRP
jgi:hypothetical protein